MVCSLQQLWETGLMRYWKSRQLPNIEKCLIKEHEPFRDEVQRTAPLTIRHLSGAFVLLGIGAGISVFIFLVESFLYRHTGKK